MTSYHAKLIVNPAAGGYAVRREWPRLRRELRRIGLSFDYEQTAGVGHAMQLARKAVDSGCRYIIAVGGDGTVNEVANGILTSTAAADVILGVLNAGTACSFARSIGMPSNCIDACSRLTGQGRMLIDVGVVEYHTAGKPAKRFFINEADVGFGAAVVEGLKQVPISFGRSINYAPFVISTVKTLFDYENKPVTLCAGNEDEENRVCSMVVVANGPYYGGAMQVAPHAKLDDGLLDVIIVGDMEKPELANVWMMSYTGSHIAHPKVTVKKVSNLTVKSSERVLVEADGELLGKGPATFSVLPRALKIVV